MTIAPTPAPLPARARAALVAALSLALACTGRAKEPPLAALPPAVHVEAAPAEARPMPRELPLAGALIANREADVAANAAGRVIRTFVERGAMVRAGDPLVQLDVRSAAMGKDEALGNLEAVEAQRALADTQCARYEGLFQKGAISRDEWDRFATQCRTSAGSERAARARADMARKTLADATVRAPFPGMVGERFVDVGEYVHPDSKVASLVQIAPLRLQLTVPEAEVGRIAPKQVVSFEVQSFPGESFRATVAFVGPALRAATRDLVAEAVVPNEDRRLRPGMFATAHLELPSEPVVAVPRSALRGEGASARLFTVKDGRIEERIVQPGIERDGYVAVLDGLRAGERVVTRPTDQIRDGMPVR
jgi:membrane fusion protein (multidrug efflux system)